MKKLAINARVLDVVGIGTNIVAFYNDSEELATDSYLAVIIPEIDQLAQSMTTAYNQDKVKSEFAQADAARDAAVRKLADLIEGYSLIPDEEKNRAAQPLKDVFDRYGRRIVRLSYGHASMNVNSLLEDLADEDLAESIASLDGMAEAIEALRASQTAFDELTVAYATAIGQRAASAYSYRTPLLQVINSKLVPYLNTVALAFPDKYGTFAGNVESAIAAVNTTVRKRKNRAKASSEADTDTEADSEALSD